MTIRSPSRWVLALLGLVLVPSACTRGGPSPKPSASNSAYRLRVATASFHLAAPVQREVAVASGGRIYLAGGLAASGTSAGGVFSIDPTNGTQRFVGTLPRSFHDAAGAMIGNRLFVFGGGTDTSSDVVQAMDLSTGKGSIVGHLPRPLSDLASATIAGTTYLIGGYDGRTPQATIYATSDGATFRAVARLPQGLRYPAVAAVGTSVVIAGGIAASGAVPAVYWFDPATGRVRSIGGLPAPTSHAIAFSLRGVVYVAGGLDGSGHAVREVSAIDPAAGTVRPSGALRAAVSDAAAATIGATAWVLGGWRGTAVSQVLHATVQEVPPAPSSPGPSPSASPADPASVRPFAGLMVIADRGNNRLVVVDASKRVVWTYPSPDLPRPPFRFYFPDDAFWVHGGHAILVNEEENHVLAEIAYPSGQTLWTYGHPGVAGTGRGYLHQPDDVYPYPGGGLVVADAQNCRILFFGPKGHVTRQIGQTGNCTRGLPRTVGYPNGDTPLPNGDLLVSELHGGGFIDRITGTGKVIWSVHVPGVDVPSDPQRLADGTYLTVDYATPAKVVVFTDKGKVVWSYGPTSGRGELSHPSLAAPLPNGLIAVNDDYAHRVVLIDPETNRIVWQYGHLHKPGTKHGYLNIPDGLDLLLPDGTTPLHVDFASDVVVMGRP
jgi:outer membrane protein assembly factor BamB